MSPLQVRVAKLIDDVHLGIIVLDAVPVARAPLLEFDPRQLALTAA